MARVRIVIRRRWRRRVPQPTSRASRATRPARTPCHAAACAPRRKYRAAHAPRALGDTRRRLGAHQHEESIRTDPANARDARTDFAEAHLAVELRRGGPRHERGGTREGRQVRRLGQLEIDVVQHGTGRRHGQAERRGRRAQPRDAGGEVHARCGQQLDAVEIRVAIARSRGVARDGLRTAPGLGRHRAGRLQTGHPHEECRTNQARPHRPHCMPLATARFHLRTRQTRRLTRLGADLPDVGADAHRRGTRHHLLRAQPARPRNTMTARSSRTHRRSPVGRCGAPCERAARTVILSTMRRQSVRSPLAAVGSTARRKCVQRPIGSCARSRSTASSHPRPAPARNLLPAAACRRAAFAYSSDSKSTLRPDDRTCAVGPPPAAVGSARPGRCAGGRW